MVNESKTGAGDYRPFVDGLRAIAILAVVGYHTGLPGFSGGFVGVDVFFVISGFLIIGHITQQMRQDRFSLTDFYARRILRLVPLLLTVLLVSSAIAAVILATPAEYREFGQSAAAAATMLSNNYFLSSEGYFDTAADTKVLLHTWSLGVEAQFYVVTPILIWLLTRPVVARGRNRLLIAGAAIIFVLSYIGCVHYTAARNAAFFLMQYRAWEFVAGAAAGALANRLRSYPIVAHILGLLGFALIIGCVFFYSAAMLYPSWYPLLPVLGATFVIAAGEANADTYVRRLLATPPFVGLGLVSYGWYLWHWPLLTFGRIYRFGSRDLVPDLLLGAGLSLVLAIATYFLIERPVSRNKRRILSQRRIITVGLGLAACLLVAIPGVIYQRVVSPAAAAHLSPEEWPEPTSLETMNDGCIVDKNYQISTDCLPGIGNKPLGLLMGDSHAREAYNVLHEKAAKSDVGLITMVKLACPPLINTDVLARGKPEKCPDMWHNSLQNLQDLHAQPNFAILYASWNIYIGGNNGYRPLRTLLTPGSKKKSAADQYQALQQGLTETVKSLEALGVQRILIVAPEPQFLREAPGCLIHAHQWGQSEDRCTRPQAEIEAQHVRTLAALKAVSTDHQDIRVIDPFQALCDGTLCRQHFQGVPAYFDDNHLSKAGNELLFGTFAQDLAWVLGPGAAVSVSQ